MFSILFVNLCRRPSLRDTEFVLIIPVYNGNNRRRYNVYISNAEVHDNPANTAEEILDRYTNVWENINILKLEEYKHFFSVYI